MHVPTSPFCLPPFPSLHPSFEQETLGSERRSEPSRSPAWSSVVPLQLPGRSRPQGRLTPARGSTVRRATHQRWSPALASPRGLQDGVQPWLLLRRALGPHASTARRAPAALARQAQRSRLADSRDCRVPRASRRADRATNGRARGCRAKSLERLRRGHAPPRSSHAVPGTSSRGVGRRAALAHAHPEPGPGHGSDTCSCSRARSVGQSALAPLPALSSGPAPWFAPPPDLFTSEARSFSRQVSLSARARCQHSPCWSARVPVPPFPSLQGASASRPRGAKHLIQAAIFANFL